jgi:hypothetical protein
MMDHERSEALTTPLRDLEESPLRADMRKSQPAGHGRRSVIVQ